MATIPDCATNAERYWWPEIRFGKQVVKLHAADYVMRCDDEDMPLAEDIEIRAVYAPGSDVDLTLTLSEETLIELTRLIADDIAKTAKRSADDALEAVAYEQMLEAA